jgi:hypothetical protein
MRTAPPHSRSNVTRAVKWNGHAFTVTIDRDPYTWRPAKVFADTSKGGQMAATLADACVLVSIALQHGITPADLAKSLGCVPVLWGDERQDAPASPIGAIVEVIQAEVQP